MYYKEKTNKGQSGGPIIEQKSGKFFAVGVHLGGYKDH
jgi:V8-like Glu-specific endopeptidase